MPPIERRFTTGKVKGVPIVTYCSGCNVETIHKDLNEKVGIFCRYCGTWLKFRQYKTT